MTASPAPLVLAALLPLAALLAACTPGAAPATPAPTATTAATPQARGTPPEATVLPSDERPTAGVLLIDVGSGQVNTLYEGPSFPSVRGFEEDSGLWIVVAGEDRSLRFDAAGTLVEEVPGYGPARDERCQPVERTGEPRAIIDGREYPVACGTFSPDGRYMLYVLFPPAEGAEGTYPAWLLDLDTGNRALLSDALRDCGGCDYRAGPAWSPSGRWVIFGELYAGEDSTVYLADTRTNEARRIAQGPYVNNLGSQPRWSPVEDAFIASTPDGWTRLERPSSGEVTELRDVPWPARFDESGEYVYSFAEPGKVYAERDLTLIAEVATGEVVAEWSGRPHRWPLERGVAAVDGEPAALLEQSDDCPGGTAVRLPSLSGGLACIEGALGAIWDTSRTRVAFARKVDEEGRAVPGGAAWDIAILDLASGAERVLATGIHSPFAEPPLVRWDADGLRLLVQWPRPEMIW